MGWASLAAAGSRRESRSPLPNQPPRPGAHPPHAGQGLFRGPQDPVEVGGSAGARPGRRPPGVQLLVTAHPTSVVPSPKDVHHCAFPSSSSRGADPGQCLSVPRRHHRGHHVLLHGRPQAPQGLPGGPPVAGGEDEPGGAEPAAGEALWGGPGFRSQVRKERAQCSSTARPGRTGFGLLKAHSRSSSLCLVNVRLPLFLPTSPRLPSLPTPFIWPVIENFAS